MNLKNICDRKMWRKLYNFDERNKRKQMKMYFVFMNCKI